MKEFPVSKVYRLLEPGPVVLVTTRARNGTPDIMTMGFHMVIRHDSPPLLGCIIGPWDHSYTALRDTGECVIAIPGADLAEIMVDIGNCSGRDTDKFARFGFTQSPAKTVSAPLTENCLANIECRVADTTMVDRLSLWILEPQAAWINPDRPEQRTLHHRGDGTFTIDGPVISLRERMVLWKQFQD
ncbi:flavin reductase family protein [Acetobacter oeni]|uniref:Flavin reductase n=1 Tax=Acetobacter oeni TaxID=304077 RepID=A0A511XKZ7_9PROT|nr:flavin reductase family protein [Acetobacter oeni]MBB3883224.1 flavin reductase (DIM6/NTAB) family NADH-FMN oxidoreductase RutF [Acetobacter oeni]NHO19290.1 flavin reductase family protein [Acetobacter oeni]GBR07261.1 flavin reductase domain-containing protein [Acetobacter oeni LMG 21952]GEN63627.1 flavin reductase [Acetobacter oeni]